MEPWYLNFFPCGTILMAKASLQIISMLNITLSTIQEPSNSDFPGFWTLDILKKFPAGLFRAVLKNIVMFKRPFPAPWSLHILKSYLWGNSEPLSYIFACWNSHSPGLFSLNIWIISPVGPSGISIFKIFSSSNSYSPGLWIQYIWIFKCGAIQGLSYQDISMLNLTFSRLPDP